ncbi:MAG: alpha/beta hydrolase [Mailhella sp.]|jgi:acetyl esterase/lipase|nr:alpha/beta hydrolase [Mailhella sp.]
MSKTINANVMSRLLKMFSLSTEERFEHMVREALRKGEKPAPPPKAPETRFEDRPDGRVFYANEGSRSGTTVFYLHGGAYFMDLTRSHWKFLETLIKKADVQVVTPAYRLVPFATYREAFDLVLPLYKEYCEAHPGQRIILMGDSAGGGLALALAEQFKAEGIRMPDGLVLLSPWVDISLDNEQIGGYAPVDPFLSVQPLRLCARYWTGGLDMHDWHVSPIFGDLEGIRHVTVFTGTREILYPDITKFFSLLDDDPSNELIVGEGMVHVYPLFPIPEAELAMDTIIRALARQ